MSKKVKYVRASNSKNVEYWKEREDEARQRYIAEEERYDKRLKEIYDLTLDKVNKEINGFYGKYAKAEGITIAEAKKRVTQLEIEEYARKAKEYVKNKDFSKEANEEMKLYNATMRINRLEMLKANIGLELVAGNNELSKEMEAMLTDRAMKEYERLSGILGDTVRLNAKDARALVNASYMNATFSQRIWTHQDMLKKEIDSLLREGIIQGRNPYVLARHLEKRFGVSRNNARRLMRTELQRVQSAAELLALEDAEYDEYQYLAEPTACPVCRVLDGKHWKLKEAEPADNLPPMHPWCRCTISAYMDDEEYEEWLRGKENGTHKNTWESKETDEKERKVDKKFKRADFRVPHMNEKEKELARYADKTYDEIKVSEETYARLKSALNAAPAWMKEQGLIEMRIDDIIYMVVNKGFDDYKIISARNGETGINNESPHKEVNEALDEVFGTSEWRYW